MTTPSSSATCARPARRSTTRSSTCSMGADETSVVDPELRVRGVEAPARRRRVGDAERAAREHQRAGDRDRRARRGPHPRARDAQRECGPSDGSVRLSRAGIARYAPIADWLPRYDRSMLRGDVLAGIAVAAMIVPEGPGLRRHRGHPGPERAVRRGGGGDRLRAVLHVAPHLDGAELVAGRRRRRRRARRGRRGAAGRRAGGGHHARDRRAVPAAGGAAARLDRAVPLAGGRHRLPGGSGGRRRHRRAAEADRHRCGGRDRVGRARVVAPVARRRERDDGARRGRGARGHPRSALLGPAGAGRARARRRRAARDTAVQSRRPRSRARRRRAPRPAHAGPAGRRRLHASTTRRSSRRRPGCC